MLIKECEDTVRQQTDVATCLEMLTVTRSWRSKGPCSQGRMVCGSPGPLEINVSCFKSSNLLSSVTETEETNAHHNSLPFPAPLHLLVFLCLPYLVWDSLSALCPCLGTHSCRQAIPSCLGSVFFLSLNPAATCLCVLLFPYLYDLPTVLHSQRIAADQDPYPQRKARERVCLIWKMPKGTFHRILSD